MQSAHPDSLTAECDLWILPPPAHSHWFSHIDWYLNWQMCKGLTHTPVKPPAELFQVMEEGGLNIIMDPPVETAPLMVASLGRLPAAKCVVLPYTKGVKTWLKQAHHLATSLHAIRIRVFLPHGADDKEARETWSGYSGAAIEAEFTTDIEANQPETTA